MIHKKYYWPFVQKYGFSWHTEWFETLNRNTFTKWLPTSDLVHGLSISSIRDSSQTENQQVFTENAIFCYRSFTPKRTVVLASCSPPSSISPPIIHRWKKTSKEYNAWNYLMKLYSILITWVATWCACHANRFPGMLNITKTLYSALCDSFCFFLSVLQSMFTTFWFVYKWQIFFPVFRQDDKRVICTKI